MEEIKALLSNQYVQLALLMIVMVFTPAAKVLIARLIVAIKLRTPDYIDSLIDVAASYGAQYAEQMGHSLELLGHEKMDMALAAAARRLARYGVNVDEDELRERIEASLQQLSQRLAVAVGEKLEDALAPLGFGAPEGVEE